MSENRHLFYIHGFNSSPLSAKARQVGDYLASLNADINFHVPVLPFDPDKAIAILDREVQSCLPGIVGLIGSSMGGYYGTWIAEKYNLKLAMVNPAARPYELLADYMGEQVNDYTGERFTFEPKHMDSLKALEIGAVSRPDNFLLLTQTGDEVLDYREAVNKFADCRQVVQEGGSHAFDDFESMLPMILDFLGMTA